MGGNVIFEEHSADRIEIRNHAGREFILDRLSQLFAFINRDLRLWNTSKHTIEEYLAGSTVFLFDTEIPTQTLIDVKPTFGDVDIQVDKNRKDDIIKWLSRTDDVSTYDLMGYLLSVDTIVTLWRDRMTMKNYQIDLELVDFVGNLPSPWARFSRSSSWEDLEFGIKGFAHKYIFRAITAKDLITTNIRLKTKLLHDKKITPVVFSPKGARRKYRPVGVNVWEEIPMKDSVLVTDLEDLFELFFDGKPMGDEFQLIFSYRGVVELIHRYIDPKDHLAIVDGMAHLLWSEGAQGIVRGDKISDFNIKCFAYDYLVEILDVGQAAMGYYHPLAVEYYKNY